MKFLAASSLILVVLLQLSSAIYIKESYDDVVKRLKEDIALDKRLLKIKIQTYKTNVEIAEDVIEFDIDDATRDVKNLVQQLQNQVSLAKVEAAKQNKNIDSCVEKEEESVKKVDLEQLVTCKSKANLDVATKALEKAQLIDGKYDALLEECGKVANGDGLKLETCVVDKETEYQAEFSGLREQINAVTKDAKKTVDSCLAKVDVPLVKLVGEAENEFKKCTKEILN